jgi:hypothetical protein
MRNTILLSVLLCASLSNGYALTKHYKKEQLELLAPSHDNLMRQNTCVDQMKLIRVQDEVQLAALVEQGELTALPKGRPLAVNPALPRFRRYALPRTNRFLVALSEDFYATFHTPITVDSAVRPKTVQEQVLKHNKSAAPADISAHTTGAAVDLSKRLTGRQLKWLRDELSMYQATQVIIVEEERRCFHIVVIGEVE